MKRKDKISILLILTAISVILNSLSFWFNKSDVITDTANSLMINFATYPDGIFKGLVRILFFTIIPIGFAIYLPLNILRDFNLIYFIIVIVFAIFLVLIAFLFLQINRDRKILYKSNGPLVFLKHAGYCYNTLYCKYG